MLWLVKVSQEAEHGSRPERKCFQWLLQLRLLITWQAHKIQLAGIYHSRYALYEAKIRSAAGSHRVARVYRKCAGVN